MEDRDHLDILDFIESTLKLQEAVQEADEDIQEMIEPISF
jgi:hypothetical protein